MYCVFTFLLNNLIITIYDALRIWLNLISVGKIRAGEDAGESAGFGSIPTGRNFQIVEIVLRETR